MLPSKSKAFAKVNRKGRIVQVLREHYLRDDIWCQSAICQVCKHDLPVLAKYESPAATSKQQQQQKLQQQQKGHDEAVAKDSSTTKKQKQEVKNLINKDVTGEVITSHYIVPSVGVALKYLELFELPDLKDIILCETIMTEAQNSTSKKLYGRLRDIVSDPRRRCIVFNNEHSANTHIDRKENETSKQYEERAVYTTACWYAKHLNHQMPIVYLAEEKELGFEPDEKDEGVIVLTVGEYLEQWCADKPALKDLYESLQLTLATKGLSDEDEEKYDEHLPTDVLEAGIKSGKFIRGIIRVNRYNTKEAIVKYSQKETDIGEQPVEYSDAFVVGAKDINRAIHGDLVVVQLHPQSEWIAAKPSLKDEELEEEEGALESLPKVPTGKVVGILQRNWRPYVACLQLEDEGVTGPGGAIAQALDKSEYVLAIPFDHRIPKIRINTRQRHILQNQRIVVRISKWERDSKYPAGYYVRSLGEIGNLDTETEALLVEHEIPNAPFSAHSISELPVHTPTNPWKIPKEEIERRRDLRGSHVILSIDPIGCEDIDDALSFKILKNKNIEIGVHIADVSYFVKHNSHLDMEARSRGTTVYLVDRRFDMLPAVLSSELCSLHMQQDKLAVSVLWEFDYKTGDVVSTWFGRTVIRTKYALHYEQAQAILDDTYDFSVNHPPHGKWQECVVQKEDYKTVQTALKYLTNFATKIRYQRTSQGALELASIEDVEFELNAEHAPTKIVQHEIMQVNQMVEEWMILANNCVAKQIYDWFPKNSLLRRHPYPREQNFRTLIKSAKSKGFTISVKTNQELAESLEKAQDPNDPSVNLLLRALATRAMSEAVYFSTGELPPENFYHYGLALEYYTHFTSPIRRYADVIVHRILLLTFNGKNSITITHPPGTHSPIAVGSRATPSSIKTDDSNGTDHDHTTTTTTTTTTTETSDSTVAPAAAPKIVQPLEDSVKLAEIANHINVRHRASKLASAASNEWFRAIYFRKNVTIEDAVIFAIRQNALVLFVPRFRIVGPVYMKEKDTENLIIPEAEDERFGISRYEDGTINWATSSNLSLQFDDQAFTMTISSDKSKGIHKFKLFDHVTVQIGVEETRAHLPNIKLRLVSFSPYPTNAQGLVGEGGAGSQKKLLKDMFASMKLSTTSADDAQLNREDEKKRRTTKEEQLYAQQNDNNNLERMFQNFQERLSIISSSSSSSGDDDHAAALLADAHVSGGGGDININDDSYNYLGNGEQQSAVRTLEVVDAPARVVNVASILLGGGGGGNDEEVTKKTTITTTAATKEEASAADSTAASEEINELNRDMKKIKKRLEQIEKIKRLQQTNPSYVLTEEDKRVLDSEQKYRKSKIKVEKMLKKLQQQQQQQQ